MRRSLCSLNAPAQAAAGSPGQRLLWSPALWSPSQCPGAQAAPVGTATSSPTTPQTVATGMKRIMAVLREVQTFQKPCEGQDHLWAITYVLNLTVDLAEKQPPEKPPLRFIRVRRENDFLQKGRSVWGHLGHSNGPWVTPGTCLSCADCSQAPVRVWQQ